MPDKREYKSVAVKIGTWESLWKIAQENHRTPSQQISWFVDKMSEATLDSKEKEPIDFLSWMIDTKKYAVKTARNYRVSIKTIGERMGIELETIKNPKDLKVIKDNFFSFPKHVQENNKGHSQLSCAMKAYIQFRSDTHENIAENKQDKKDA